MGIFAFLKRKIIGEEIVKGKVKRATFYKKYRAFFKSRLSQAQVDGFEAIFNCWDENDKLTDKRWLAYILATAYHETGTKMQPVREGFCKTDEGSIKAVERMYERGRISHNYAELHKNGNSYFGRGLVQLTHGYNYKKMGRAIGLGRRLYDNPSLALSPGLSAKILVIGMVKGSFTGRGLKRYFNHRVTDWINARKIVNGLDRAEMLAKYGMRFYECIK